MTEQKNAENKKYIKKLITNIEVKYKSLRTAFDLVDGKYNTLKTNNFLLLERYSVLQESRDELLKASINFNKRILELVPFINDDRALAQNHGCEWTHGNWKTEREILISVIERAEALKDKEA